MAGVILADLTDSDDEDIVEAAYGAITMAEGQSGDENDDGDDKSVHCKGGQRSRDIEWLRRKRSQTRGCRRG